MAAIGGSIIAVSIRNRNFPVAADGDGSRKLGGYENEVQANGDGTARIVKMRVPWLFDGVQLEVDDTRGDQEFLQEVANGDEFVPVTITLASGITWQGDGTISGEVQFGTQNATATVSLSGPGDLTQQ
jgi:hypothetical protein